MRPANDDTGRRPLGSPRSIALVGGALSWQRAPWDNPQWDIWAHASIHQGVAPREADLWFEVHRPDVRAEPKSWDDTYSAWLLRGVGRTAPVMVQSADPMPVNAQVLPRHEIAAWARQHGGTDAEYVTSTGAWMLLYALYSGATEIGLWGMNYEEHGEYVVQRPCLEYWIGFARALGVSVYITPTSRLCRDAHVYGYDGHRADLQQAHGTAARLTTADVQAGRFPAPPIPPDVQALIDEERELFGIDTRALWAQAERAGEERHGRTA